MSEEAEQNNQIALFMEISGADFDTARQALTINNFNLEQAINYHLERSNAIGAPEDDVAAASTSTDANLPIDDDDEVRPPILPKREQLILPNEDNFRYRKRLTTAARTVCPLRNFELEGRMQEERLKAAVMGNLTTSGIDGSDVDETINYLPTASSNSKENLLGFSNSTRELINRQINASIAQPSTKPAVPSRLSELFRPPVDITFCGSFQAARDYAKEQNRWLIVNVQDMSDFNCQVLNRDIWSSDKLRAVIKKYFVFWQVAIDNTDGHRFQCFYGIQVFPYVGIIDPRTGEEKLSYKTGFKLTLADFMEKLKAYLKQNTPNPNADDGDVSDVDETYFETKTGNSTNNHATASPNAKRKRLEPSSLTEQEQIDLAIAHSLREVNAAEDDNKSDSFGEPSSDESDFDFDDESSNQSYVKSQTSQTFDNKITELECDSKVDEPIPSTATIVETYDNYLGDKNDAKARIQLRLPSGVRHMFEWPCTTKLKALKLYIPFKYPELTSDPYKVICPFVGGQSNNILDMDDALTLKEANLYPSSNIILHFT